MRLLYVSLALLLSVCPASAQIIGIQWDASPDPIVTDYVVNVGAALIANTTALTVPWSPTASYHRVCVSSRAGTLTGPPSCLDYGTPPAPTPPPQPSADMTLTASPASLVQGSGATVTLTFTFNGATRHQPKIDGVPISFTGVTCLNGTCSGSQTVTPTTTTTYTLSAVLSDSTPAPSVTATVTVNPLTPPPPPPTQPQPGPVVTIRSCSEYVEAEKPASATGTGWVVQYFDDGTAITTASSTRKRSVTLTPGTHPISAVWSKSGSQPIQMGTTTKVCQ